MPLSEQEQRLLDEMERHLMKNDADVVSAPSGDRALSYRNLVYGAVLLLAGVGGLIAGVAVGDVLGIVIGVVAFVAMLAGVMLAVTPIRRSTSTRPESSGTPRSSSGPSFMDRMNDRWDRRSEGR
ncbi:DUF3040 domain-containing protein [Microbacterium pseudoresistens]|uniref:F0F1-type ATP synthase assembly protein I n=1 Tax=Microbacterium pseudoresistens TaxID=640634 RepID=A0A7Y9JPK1_9MICO|nr:DUF3040 domain-containing protein [Microbacterium pseudoresistens]NYD55688.1 F0F1-type ATP synthase assembly protein I [Microbacterium pseudoresistens]